MKIGIILQARTSSSRLPQKVLKDLPFGSGITVLQQIIRRLKRSKKTNEIIVATSQDNSDDGIANVAKKENVQCFRGSLNDVLARYYWAAKDNALDIIVRITGDCPCIDPEIIDLVVSEHLNKKSDYTANVVRRSYPDGLDVEVFNFVTLDKIYYKAKEKDEREHVTAYIHKNKDEFKIYHVEAPKELYAPEMRITLDTVQDYALFCIIFDELYKNDEYFNAYDIMNLYKNKPWLTWINT